MFVRLKSLLFLSSLSLLTTSLYSAEKYEWKGREEFVDFSIDDKRNVFVRFVSFLSDIPSEAQAVVQKKMQTTVGYPEDIKNPETESKGLIVMGHGRNDLPRQFWKYIERIHSFKELEGWSLLTPALLERGNVYMDDFVEPVLQQIQAWSKVHPDLPIILIGTSNGGRLIDGLSNKILNNPMLYISLAGAHGGSLTLTIGDNLGLARFPFGVHEPIREELVVNSQRIQNLIRDCRERACKGKIHYIFIGASEDLLLLDRSLAFPKISESQENLLLIGTGHFGIVDASIDFVFSRIDDWLHARTMPSGNRVVRLTEFPVLNSWPSKIAITCLLALCGYSYFGGI